MDSETTEALQAVIDAQAAEINRLRHAIKDAQAAILFMPTWVESDSYAAQVAMRTACHNVVANILK